MLFLQTLLTISDAGAIPSECLIRSNAYPVAEIGVATNQSDFLLASASSEMRILSFTTCVDSAETLAGIQLTLYSA